MKSILRKKINTGTIIVLITALLLPGLAMARMNCQDRPGRGLGMNHNQMGYCRIWRNPEMLQALKLTDGQVKALKDLDFSFRERALTLKGRLDGLRLQMAKSFAADTVDEPAVLELARKVSDVKGKLFVQKIEARLAAEKILTVEQRKILAMRLPRAHSWSRRDRRQTNSGNYGRYN